MKQRNAASDRTASREDDIDQDLALAMQPHLALMKKTARRGTHQGRAGIGMLLLWLSDDMARVLMPPWPRWACRKTSLMC